MLWVIGPIGASACAAQQPQSDSAALTASPGKGGFVHFPTEYLDAWHNFPEGHVGWNQRTSQSFLCQEGRLVEQ